MQHLLNVKNKNRNSNNCILAVFRQLYLESAASLRPNPRPCFYCDWLWQFVAQRDRFECRRSHIKRRWRKLNKSRTRVPFFVSETQKNVVVAVVTIVVEFGRLFFPRLFSSVSNATCFAPALHNPPTPCVCIFLLYGRRVSARACWSLMMAAKNHLFPFFFSSFQWSV